MYVAHACELLIAVKARPWILRIAIARVGAAIDLDATATGQGPDFLKRIVIELLITDSPALTRRGRVLPALTGSVKMLTKQVVLWA
jgi:hypothetical protein